MIKRRVLQTVPGSGQVRSGVSILESAFVLPIMLLMVFAIADLGIAATRYNAVAEIARSVAREAIRHGSLSPSEVSDWGPNPYSGNLADGSEMVAKSRKLAVTMQPQDVFVSITWPDGDNSSRDSVHVEVQYTHQPLIPALFAWGPIEIRSSASMAIVN